MGERIGVHRCRQLHLPHEISARFVIGVQQRRLPLVAVGGREQQGPGEQRKALAAPRSPSEATGLEPRSAGWSTPCTWPRNRARRKPGRLHRDRLARSGYGRRRTTMPTCARSSSPRPSSRSRRRVRPNASPRSPATSAGSLARRSRSRQRATVAKPCSS